MINLSSSISCDTFIEFPPVTPMLVAYEFMKISRSDSNEFTNFEEFAQFKNWKFNLNKIKRFLQDRKNTIVVTCEKQKIEWVNKGFTRMTGYSSNEAIGQFPKFLQGSETTLEAKIAIRSKLSVEEKYTGKIINYRRNGERYLCKVIILPIYDNNDSLVNFIAFEREVIA
ncbi:MAG: PAS domain-containing protein [Arcicella sp.]|nr:PAS domain-containing protein [Arcicella sp.]